MFGSRLSSDKKHPEPHPERFLDSDPSLKAPADRFPPKDGVKMNQTVILVLGMHRSGTSALARVVNLMGADLGSDLMPPRPDNPAGMWEHRRIAEFHEEILGCLGLRWHSVSEMPEKWYGRKEVLKLQRRIVRTIQREFAGSPVWALKDPRMCRLLPLWHSILADLNLNVCVVSIVRSPMELALSLQERNGFGLDKSMLLWLRYVIESERETRRYPRVFVTFEQLLADWRAVVERIEERLALRFPTGTQQVSGEIDRFLKPDLRHHHARLEIGSNPTTRDVWVRNAYNTLIEAAENSDKDLPEIMTRLDLEIHHELLSFPASAVVEDMQSEIALWAERRNSMAWSAASNLLGIFQRMTALVRN